MASAESSSKALAQDSQPLPFIPPSRYVPQDKYSKWTFFISALVSVFIIAFQIYIIVVYFGLNPDDLDLSYSDVTSEIFRTIINSFIMYRACFLIACIFGSIMTWSALISKNIVQVISVGIYYVGAAAFAIIQYVQSRQYTFTSLDPNSAAVSLADILDNGFHYSGFSKFAEGFVMYTSVALTLFLFGMSNGIANEIRWLLYKRLGPRLNLRRAFLNYQIFMALIKFNAFFLVVYGIQVTTAFVLDQTLAVNLGYVQSAASQQLLYKLLLVSIPLVLITITMGFVAVHTDRVLYLWIFVVGCVGTVAGIIFVIIRTSSYQTQANGMNAFFIMRIFLYFFSGLSLLLTLITMSFGVILSKSFGSKLGQYLYNPWNPEVEEEPSTAPDDIVLE
ncbi:uncharacterized protein BJ171DRAFT_598691 [Polychytrium aggregatum]|uniref:uncharacterized protein n=1 Tax=Polychytrium aggregatum TaxID=110093 RepID=UPI0022FE4611|nr:uncharacterized protein BJ171DRAFT_598691 [Polychytrium aggregatum]KAI9205109.1 hypothetical protein BJ171DRAFT_598691 [Polychytrium aggregatum]